MSSKVFNNLEKNTKTNQIKKNIINYFLSNGKNSISELSKELELSVPTVTKLINSLTNDGLVSDFGKVQTPEGRHPNFYGLNPESAYFLGVDLSKYHVNLALMDFSGDIIQLTQNISYYYENSKQALDTLCQIIEKFLSSIKSDIAENIVNITINISGRVNPESGYSYSSFFFSEEPLSEILSERLKFPVLIENDTRSMAYGEFMKGNVDGQKNIIFINIGWGLGSGLIIDGKLYYGKSGFSGEFGHIPVFENELLCHCGKKGCLETEASGSAIYRNIIERIKNGETSIITDKVKDLNKLRLADIIEAINEEDTLAIEIVEEVGANLGKHIAGLINLFNPELVIIGGEVAETGDFLLMPIKSAIRKYSLNLVNKDSKLLLSKLKSKAGVYGACLIGRNRIFGNTN